ncbi:fimbrillin family protein, partial [Bacteroides sp. OttesenSCG-928-N06]|nr:fimbrillin family protein [Bacteroides sp. OttesenSCG-928-N06]
ATIAPQTITAGSTFLTIAAANKDMAPQYGTQRYTVKVPAGGIAFQAGKEYHYTISLGGGGQGRIVEQEINEFVAEDDVAHLNTGTPGIRTEKDLRQFAEDWNKNPNNAIIKWEDAKGSRTIRLLADIVMSDELFTPIKGFICTFDGQGHTISGLKISQTGTGTGMFQEISNIAVVRNLHLTDVNVKGGKYVGGIAGGNSGTVAGCSVQGTINANTGDGYACGIVGNNDGTIAGCYSQITTMTGKTKYGIAYRSGGLIKGCCWYSNSNTVSSAANSSTGTCLGYYQIPQLHTDKGYVDIMNTKGLDTLGAKENGYRWVHVSGANPVLVKK